MTPVAGVFPVMCPGEEAGAGLASACWPDQKPVRPVGRDPSQSCRQRFSSPDRHRSCPPTWAGGRSGCLQISWTTSSVSTRTATRTRSVSSRCAAVWSCSRRRVAADSGGYAEALASRRAACAGPARVRGRGHRLLRRGSDPLPRRAAASRCSRSAGCAGSAARAGRRTRSTRSGRLGACSRRSGLRRRAATANARRCGR